MFAAKAAMLLPFHPVGIVLLVLHAVIVALLAFIAGHRDFDAHAGHLLINHK